MLLLSLHLLWSPCDDSEIILDARGQADGEQAGGVEGEVEDGKLLRTRAEWARGRGRRRRSRVDDQRGSGWEWVEWRRCMAVILLCTRAMRRQLVCVEEVWPECGVRNGIGGCGCGCHHARVAMLLLEEQQRAERRQASGEEQVRRRLISSGSWRLRSCATGDTDGQRYGGLGEGRKRRRRRGVGGESFNR
jgi:hypothetical protein